jgi:sugar/nucleoside kinase (ribokinase family)
MAILAVGSIAFDTIKTPRGRKERVLGGSVTHFSLAASFFTEVRVVGVVGADFTAEHEAVMSKRGIHTSGIERAKGKTFHWSGEYGDNLNEAKTHLTELNVFESFKPRIPKEFLDSEVLFLANIDPVLQRGVREQMPHVKLVGGDTMNFWIGGKGKELAETLKGIDVLLINDGEAKLLAENSSLPKAANKILTMGPKAVVIKHGEYGATLFFKDGAFGLEGGHPFRAPALPIEEVFDPTGAGDSFAGGFMGYIASQPKLTRDVLKRAMFYGGVMGSFAVESFGTERVQQLTRDEIEQRFQVFQELTRLE